MRSVDSIREMRDWSEEQRRQKKRIALVPTLGFLHEGHLALVREGRRKGDLLVVSIFVNPTQFAPNEDFNTYPREFERDARPRKETGLIDPPQRWSGIHRDTSRALKGEKEYRHLPLQGFSGPAQNPEGKY